MPKFRKKPVVIEADQWFKNGDHPADGVGELVLDPGWGTYLRVEGAVVRFFRRPEPEYASYLPHELCGHIWHDHGWIDTLEGGHTVCPRDWIITGVQGERYPCKPDIFAATNEPVEDAPPGFEYLDIRVPVRVDHRLTHDELAGLRLDAASAAERAVRERNLLED